MDCGDGCLQYKVMLRHLRILSQRKIRLTTWWKSSNAQKINCRLYKTTSPRSSKQSTTWHSNCERQRVTWTHTSSRQINYRSNLNVLRNLSLVLLLQKKVGEIVNKNCKKSILISSVTPLSQQPSSHTVVPSHRNSEKTLVPTYTQRSRHWKFHIRRITTSLSF